MATLEHLDILDSSPDSRYDDITKLLCSIFRTPISQLSLVAKDRSALWGQQWNACLEHQGQGPSAQEHTDTGA